MPFALLSALAAITSGTLLTYFYDRDASLPARLCMGACTGFAALALIGFVIASLLGLTPLALFLSGVVAAAPLLLLRRRMWRERVGADARRTWAALRQARGGRGEKLTGTLVFYVVTALLLRFVFDRAMYQTAEGVFTGVDNNIGDLPFHISIITGFAYGENFPPQHTEFAGIRLTYPFLVDFLTAMFVRAGATLQGALFWQNYVLALSLVGLLHRWALKLTGDRAAALMTPAIVLLSGGFGWWHFFGETIGSGRGLFESLGNLQHDYTIMGHFGYRWGNAVTTLLIPQRGILHGVALALVVWTLWWQALDDEAAPETQETPQHAGTDAREDDGIAHGKRGKKKGKTKGKTTATVTMQPVVPPVPAVSRMTMMVAAGLVAGLLPLVHAHSLLVMLGMGGCLAWRTVFKSWGAWGVALIVLLFVPLVVIVSGVEGGWWATKYAGLLVLLVLLLACVAWPRLYRDSRSWAAFFSVALLVSAPQMFWATRESGVRAGQFFGWEFGWDNGEYNPYWFWIKNTGLFIPLLIAALLWRGRAPIVGRRLLYFYLPFTLCFVVSNVYKLSPWVWDNVKVLYYWWIASAPLVALLLARLWRQGGALRVVAPVLLVMLTLAGSLDVWRVASHASERQVFTSDGIALAALIQRETAPRSLILHAPTYNDPVYLSGRRKFIGYTGHLWSHGIDYTEREADMKRIYAGAPDAAQLIEKHGIEYVVTGPLVTAELQKVQGRVNESFFARYTKIGEVTGEAGAAYRIYKTRP